MAFSPDGKTLAAGSRRRRGAVGRGAAWAADAEPLPVPEGYVYSVAFSPDGRTLAAGCRSGDDGGVVLWDAARRERLAPAPLPVPKNSVESMVFSPDGKTLAAGRTGDVVLLDVDLDSWRRLAGQIANRNLTRAEWQHYFPDTPYRPTFDDLPVPPETDPERRTSTSAAAPDVAKVDPE